MVILDTSVLIDYLRRPQEANSPLSEFDQLHPAGKRAVSILTIQELYSGQSSKELKKEQLFLALVSSLEILSYTYETAKLAGEIARDLGRPLGFPDAAIAATAILNKAKLFTLNKKDFQGIKDLKLI